MKTTLSTLLLWAALFTMGMLAFEPIALAADPPTMERDISRSGERWALVVGVDDYDDPQIQDLAYSGNDARKVAEKLINGGWSRNRVIVMTPDQDNPTLRPTGANLRAQLGRLVSLEDVDTVLFYFSGHGSAIQDGESTANLLFPQDTSLFSLSDTGVALPWLLRRLEQVDTSRRLLILDACRNRLQTDTKAPPNPWDLSGVVYPTGTQVLYSTRQGQVSCEDESTRLGWMTRFLVEGLEGQADGVEGGRRDGEIDTGELHAWLVQAMREQSSSCGLQIPTRSGEFDLEFEVVHVARPPRPEEEACLSTDDRLRLDLEVTLAAYTRLDSDAFREVYGQARCRVNGLGEVVSPEVAAVWHLLEAVRALYYQDEANGLRALRAAFAADETLQIPMDLVERERRLTILQDRLKTPVEEPRLHLVSTPGVTWWVDGVATEVLPAERPHLIQATWPDGSVQVALPWWPGQDLPQVDAPPTCVRLIPAKQALRQTALTTAILSGTLAASTFALNHALGQEQADLVESCPGSCDTSHLDRLRAGTWLAGSVAIGTGALAISATGTERLLCR